MKNSFQVGIAVAPSITDHLLPMFDDFLARYPQVSNIVRSACNKLGGCYVWPQGYKTFFMLNSIVGILTFMSWKNSIQLKNAEFLDTFILMSN